MLRRQLARCVLVLAAVLAWPAAAPAAEAPMQVYTSVIPVKTLVEAVGGDRVAVTALVQPGQSPATFDPGPRTLASLEGTEVYFRVGVPFERSWMARLRAAAPRMSVVDLRDDVKLRAIGAHAHEHSDEANAADDLAGLSPDVAKVVDAMGEGRVPREVADPHLWTSPANAVPMVKRIRDALTREDPAHRAEYEQRAADYIERLNALDKRIAERLAPLKGRRFVVFHPAWGYFADRYGLVQLAIEADGKSPGGSELDKLIEEIRGLDVSAVFVQDQFSQRSARTIADALGIKVVSIDPLAADYIDNLDRVSQRIAEALQ
ncbi:zinc ABC transporter substrate-binding protein [Arhodomonas aquaeolei]|uniref:metal ABC transporter solute-binding protein, Zn/Mn family n=1 Tax=Arhodomonas aquaeolei TaxID=2369 RepID=UPI0003A2DBA4|nr:zinc ABC transporter substrate-binding protein [Arhodomonas aquaeolei]MCS4504526.1 zinc ABC transporter substrate-binding protein [Arhodomonas aquaeolei]